MTEHGRNMMLLCQQSISDNVEGSTTAAVATGPATRNYQNVQPLGLVLGSTNPSPETPKDENERDESLDTLPKSPFSDLIRNEHTSLLSRDIVDDQFKEIFGGRDPDADTPFARALSLSNELKPKLKMCAEKANAERRMSGKKENTFVAEDESSSSQSNSSSISSFKDQLSDFRFFLATV